MNEDQATVIVDRRREARARRKADCQGFMLYKDRARTWSVHHQGGYIIVDVYNNALVAGENYAMSLEDIERFLMED